MISSFPARRSAPVATSRNRRRRQRQHMHIGFESPSTSPYGRRRNVVPRRPQQPKRGELHRLGQQRMRADDNIHRPSEIPLRTSVASFAVTMRDSCAILIGSPANRAVNPVMLPRQQRRRHHHRDLGAAHGGNERRPQRHLGLAEATSPQISRSIGRPEARSSSTSAMARDWSSVSANGKRAQNSSKVPSGGVMMSASRTCRDAAI